MIVARRSQSPTVLLRITEGGTYMHRAFRDFSQASRSAEAFAEAGFGVVMLSATGRFLMRFEPKSKRGRV
ncbi:MAG: hypothetical protein NVSMB14_06200 [Isosphaeraceae bacterium]